MAVAVAGYIYIHEKWNGGDTIEQREAAEVGGWVNMKT